MPPSKKLKYSRPPSVRPRIVSQETRGLAMHHIGYIVRLCTLVWLCACSSPAALPLLPTASEEETAFFYVTDRASARTQGKTITYTAQRNPSMAFGLAHIDTGTARPDLEGCAKSGGFRQPRCRSHRIAASSCPIRTPRGSTVPPPRICAPVFHARCGKAGSATSCFTCMDSTAFSRRPWRRRPGSGRPLVSMRCRSPIAGLPEIPAFRLFQG